MALDLSGYGKLFKFLYTDLCDVYRYETLIDQNGATRKRRNTEPEYKDLPCLISPETADDASPRELSHIPLEQYVSIHTTPDITLTAGDYIVLRKMSHDRVMRTYTGTIGEPKCYPTHIKATMKIDRAEK